MKTHQPRRSGFIDTYTQKTLYMYMEPIMLPLPTFLPSSRLLPFPGFPEWNINVQRRLPRDHTGSTSYFLTQHPNRQMRYLQIPHFSMRFRYLMATFTLWPSTIRRHVITPDPSGYRGLSSSAPHNASTIPCVPDPRGCGSRRQGLSERSAGRDATIPLHAPHSICAQEGRANCRALGSPSTQR